MCLKLFLIDKSKWVVAEVFIATRVVIVTWGASAVGFGVITAATLTVIY